MSMREQIEDLQKISQIHQKRLDALERDSASQGFVNTLCQRITDLYLRLDEVKERFSMWRGIHGHLRAHFDRHTHEGKCAAPFTPEGWVEDFFAQNKAEQRERTTVEEFEKAEAKAGGHVAVSGAMLQEQLRQEIKREKQRWGEIYKIEAIIDRIPRGVSMILYDKGIRAEDLE